MSRGDGVTRWCGEEDASWSSHIDFEAPPRAVLICPSAVCAAERTSGLVVDYLHSVSGSTIDPLLLPACGS